MLTLKNKFNDLFRTDMLKNVVFVRIEKLNWVSEAIKRLV